MPGTGKNGKFFSQTRICVPDGQPISPERDSQAKGEQTTKGNRKTLKKQNRKSLGGFAEASTKAPANPKTTNTLPTGTRVFS
jgi:hypothetical protein